MKMTADTLLKDSIIREVRKDNCFDFIRYFFALSLIIAHYCTLTETEQFWIIEGTNRVKAFFTITGFLVTYSYLRRNGDLVSYLNKRFCRIVPAYIVCILFCIILGACVTTHNIIDFLTDTQTSRYAICNLLMLNWLEPELPNTFQENYMPQMNGSLWSMKQEVIFYLLVPILLYIIKRSHRVLSTIILSGCIILYNFVNVQTQYFIFFISGMTLLLYFDQYMKNIKWYLPISTILYLFINFIQIPILTPICATIEPITFPMMLIGIAYCCKPLFIFKKVDNITYGLYLYHFPVIQTLILMGVTKQSNTIGFIFTIFITFVLASISWFAVEKRMMNTNIISKFCGMIIKL